MDKSKREISLLTETDPRLQLLNVIYVGYTKKNHVQKRKQQRGITHDMIKIAIVYGNKSWNYGQIKYTLTDRCLENTVYKKYVDKLRGLSVIGDRQINNQCSILTTYWDSSIKKSKKHCYGHRHHH